MRRLPQPPPSLRRRHRLFNSAQALEDSSSDCCLAQKLHMRHKYAGPVEVGMRIERGGAPQRNGTH